VVFAAHVIDGVLAILAVFLNFLINREVIFPSFFKISINKKRI
jgi:hypothetical protein